MLKLMWQFENAIHKARCKVWQQERLNRLEMEDLDEKLRKAFVAFENGTINANEVLAKVARLLKNADIDFLEILSEAFKEQN